VTIIIGLVVSLVCMLGGYMAMGGKLGVLNQPWEFVIICGAALGTFIVANPMPTIKDTGKALGDAFFDRGPKHQDYLDVLGLLFALMQEMKSKTSAEVEAHIDAPDDSPIFTAFPNILKDRHKVDFIADYVRIMIIGTARPHEIDALMDEEIHTIEYDKLKPYHAMQAMSDGLPALGIVAAVLGIIKAMGSLDKPPEVLGALIGSALVGTFAGIFMSYGIAGPIATKIKTVRSKQVKSFVIIKQTLIAYMSGATPHIAIEHGRKTISSKDRPSIDVVEEQMMNVAAPAAAE